MMKEDTICAIASGVGGAVSVIRISGPEARSVCDGLWRSRSGKSLAQLPPRMLTLGEFGEPNATIDPSCLAVFMQSPNSFTGEDVVELHCHGGSLCSRAVLSSLLKVGARLAEPGEFSKRAFLNGKMDLVQAEAIADMVSAGSEAALKIAGNQLKGRLGERIRAAQNQLQELLAEAESRLDFPEEQLDWKPPEAFSNELQAARDELKRLAETRDKGELLREGVSLVIAGPPNAGKSTLLNHLLGRDRAIVSDIPGTTRDTIEATVQINGIPFHLTDTAGIRGETSDAIESAGMERTRQAAESARLVVWLKDGTRPLAEQAWPDWKIQGKLLEVVNKCDAAPCNDSSEIRISALTGQGIESLCSAMTDAVHSSTLENSDIAVAARHADLLLKAVDEIECALPNLEAEEWELLAFHLREAVQSLRLITGEVVQYDVLDTIFSKFCIGK